MKKIKKNKLSIYHKIGIIYVIILLTISTAYSFLNEDLSLKTTTSMKGTNTNYKVEITQISKTDYNGIYYYEYNVIITYLGNETTTGWNTYIEVPYTTQVTGCYNANSCNIEGQTLTVTNADYNANLSPSNTSASFNLRIETDESDYSLKVLDVQFKTNSQPIDPDPEPDPDPDNPDNPDKPSKEPTIVDYLKASYVLQNDWGTRQWYVLTIENTSDTVTIASWTATFKVTSDDTMTNANIWGGTYSYDEASGIITVSGPSWSPSLAPSSKAEVNFQITPPEPELISFEGITSTGEKITTTIN